RRLNAITRVLGEEALAAADSADKKVAAGEPTGPLHGVPFTVKENIDVAGSATTQGVSALAEADPGLDAPQVANLREAGAIPMARTNLPDFALRWHTDNALRGATRTPWDPERTPGGSSGGEAVALATGMTLCRSPARRHRARSAWPWSSTPPEVGLHLRSQTECGKPADSWPQPAIQ